MLLASAAALGGGAASGGAPPEGPAYRKVLKVGVLSATIRGKPQPCNGHTWHFAQYLYPRIDLDAFCSLIDPGTTRFFRSINGRPHSRLARQYRCFQVRRNSSPPEAARAA
jgi:hypothetical protein